jgi:ABC-type transport system substrate-binding protein
VGSRTAEQTSIVNYSKRIGAAYVYSSAGFGESTSNVVRAGNAFIAEAGELLASFYARIGIKLELKFLTWHAFLHSVVKGEAQLYMLAWVADYPDAENFLQLFYSKNIKNGQNRSRYSNPEFDAEYEKALLALSPEERNRHWRRCQEIVREDCPWIYTHITKNYTLVNPWIGGYKAHDFPYGHEKHYRKLKK